MFVVEILSDLVELSTESMHSWCLISESVGDRSALSRTLTMLHIELAHRLQQKLEAVALA